MTAPRLPTTSAGRRRARGVTAVEAALGVSIAGSVCAVAVPAFLRDLHGSRFAEPVAGLAAIGEAAVARATPLPIDQAFPATVTVTPLHPPRGVLAADPPGTWQAPTWVALHFPPAPPAGPFADGQPHAFAYGFDSTLGPSRSRFVAHAHGDLDGDGVTSTFEIRGHDDASGAAVEPGMYIQDELE